MYYDENELNNSSDAGNGPNEYNNSSNEYNNSNEYNSANDTQDAVDNNSGAGQENYNNSSSQQNSYYNNDSNSNQNNYYNNQNGYYNNGSYYSGNDNPDNNKGNKKVWGIIAVVVGIVFVVSAVGMAISLVTSRNEGGSVKDLINGETATKEAQYEDIGSTDVQDKSDSSTSSSGIIVTDVSGIVDNTIPSIVAITSTTMVESSYNYYNDFFDYYFGGGDNRGGETYEAQSAGSGIIVDQTDTELLIVTNNHVVEGADSLEIQFNGQDEKDTIKGYLKGTDANVDVAVVAVKLEDIPNTVLENIKKATLGDSDAVKVGEGVIAIGNALGYGQSVTTGVISAKDREATIEDKTMTLLQTDAAINGGNSGGALINARGEVIGINVAKYSSSGSDTSASIEGMGFAIPISSVKSIIDTLETKETRAKVSEEEKGYLGIVGFDVTAEDQEIYSMPEGVLVYNLTEGGPAEKAGIVKSDVITKLDGQAVTSMENLQSMLSYYKAGEKVVVTIAYRDGREYTEKDVTVTLAAKSEVETTEE